MAPGINEYIANLPARPLNARGLSRELEIAENEYPGFRSLTRDMLSDGSLAYGSGRTLPQPQGTGSNDMSHLRCTAQACHSPSHMGHFALVSKDYCHFSSPIRRYPDLVVQRLSDSHLRGALAGSPRSRAAVTR